MSASRYLLVGLSNIGDAVMTTAVLEALHRHAPGAVVDVVGDSRSSEIFAGCPFVGRVVHKDKRGLLRGLPDLVRHLRRDCYAVVVDLRTDFLPLLLRADRRLFRWRARPLGPHAVQRHLGVVAPLCADAGAAAPRLWLRAADVDFARAALGKWADGRLLALGPGANWAPKIWPRDNFIDLIARVERDFDAVVILGAAADRALAAGISAAARLPCIDLSGQTGLLQAAAVLARVRAFVGNDSGLGHIAAAMQSPTLTLFGPGDPVRYHPWGTRAAWLVQPQADLSRLAASDVVAALADLLRGRVITGTLPGEG
jgi:heptosyltransferase III